jgi:hypothetical protein
MIIIFWQWFQCALPGDKVLAIISFLNVIVVGVFSYLIFLATRQSAEATKQIANVTRQSILLTEQIRREQEKKSRLIFLFSLRKTLLGFDKALRDMISERDSCRAIPCPPLDFDERELALYLDKMLLMNTLVIVDAIKKAFNKWENNFGNKRIYDKGTFEEIEVEVKDLINKAFILEREIDREIRQGLKKDEND